MQLRLKNLVIIFPLVFFYFCFSSLIRKEKLPPIKITKQVSAVNYPTKILKYINAGIPLVLADLIWIQTLIEMDLEHYRKKDLNSWTFLRFKSITTLDPKFLFSYQLGGNFLYVIKDDIYGALELLKSGLEVFPDDYHLNFLSGVINFVDYDHYQIASDHFNKIKDYPFAPPYLKTLTVRLLAQENKIQTAYKLLLNVYYQQTKENDLKKRYRNMLYSLKAEMDLSCLNQNKEQCSLTDFNGYPYIKNGDRWYAQEKWKKMRLFKKSRS